MAKIFPRVGSTGGAAAALSLAKANHVAPVSVLWESPEARIPPDPETLIIDEIVSLGKFGLTADSQSVALAAVITKPSVPAVKASLLLNAGGGNLDTAVQASVPGSAGNAISVAVTGDSGAGAGVTISRTHFAFVIHFEAGVSTVAHVEAAIDALAGADDLIEVMTPGTGATVLAAGDVSGATNLAGGTGIAKATLLLPNIGTLVRARVPGATGNDITVAAVADSGTGVGVTISRVDRALTIHFEPDVSTPANVETAIDALTGADKLIEVRWPSASGAALAAAAAFAATNLADGADSQGSRVPTSPGGLASYSFPGTPDQDPVGYEVGAYCVLDPAAEDLPYLSNEGAGPGSWDDLLPASLGYADVSPDVSESVRGHGVFRARAWTGSTVYTAAEQDLYDSYDYRVKFVLSGPNLVVWEKEVPLVADVGAVLVDETVDLAELGLSTSPHNVAVLFEMKRNGVTINSPLGSTNNGAALTPGNLDGSEPLDCGRLPYPGESIDPPTYGVLGATPVVGQSYPDWAPLSGQAGWNANPALWGLLDEQKGPRLATRPSYEFATRAMHGNVHVGPMLPGLLGRTSSKIRVRAWRTQDALPAQYVDESLALVAVPGDAGDNCTLRVFIIAANDYLSEGRYPFVPKPFRLPVLDTGDSVGTGAEQELGHLLGVTPALVLVVPVSMADDSAFIWSEGTHDETKLRLTVTTGVSFRYFAFSGKSVPLP